jgi:amino acid transporter
LVSVFLVWQIVPWLLSGFESVGKYSEEASSDFKSSGFFIAIALTIFTGLAFFWVVISAVACVAPWQALESNQQFPTAVAFERALAAHWIVVLIMVSALVALIQAFNANLIASSRLLFAMARRKLIVPKLEYIHPVNQTPNLIASSRLLFAMARRKLIVPKLEYIHPVNQTPTIAIIVVGGATALTMFLGEAGLVPILEVGAVSSALGWMAGCVSFYCMKPDWRGRAAATFGVLVTLSMCLAKVLPMVHGHFTVYEWMALAIWTALGAAVSVPWQLRSSLLQKKARASQL